MAAHQCPRCELRFSFRTEVEWHLANDHRAVTPAADTASSDSTDAASHADGELLTTPTAAKP